MYLEQQDNAPPLNYQTTFTSTNKSEHASVSINYQDTNDLGLADSTFLLLKNNQRDKHHLLQDKLNLLSSKFEVNEHKFQDREQNGMKTEG